MQFTITAVDHAPADLYDQVPFVVESPRQVAGPDRPDHCIACLQRPFFRLRGQHRRLTAHVVLAARWDGTRLGRPTSRMVRAAATAYTGRHGLMRDSRRGTHSAFHQSTPSAR